MASFEYLRSLSIGYYFPGTSFLHQRDARVKLLAFFGLLLAGTLTNSIIGLGLGFLFLLLGFILGKLSYKPVLRTMLSVLPFILILAIIQLFLHRPSGDSTFLWSWWWLQIYDSAIISVVLMLLRFLTLISLLSLMTSVVSTLEMNHALEMLFRPLERIGLRTSGFVLVIQIMLRFLPLLALRMEQIAKAQASRGASWDTSKGGFVARIRLVFPLLIPLFISTLNQADRTADAMISRGFGIHALRSHYYAYAIDFKDILFLLIVIAGAVGTLLV